MGKIFYILGKSASGKDSLYQALRADQTLGLKGVTMYTTDRAESGRKTGASISLRMSPGLRVQENRRNS